MATVINEILTRFITSGAGDVTRESDRIGRSQTRLGNSSANASRAFAAQSSGLGGLVAAYAGAAATAFALEAAFTSLANSARALQTIEGLTTLAAASAENGQQILSTIREITNAQLTLVEAAQQANLSLSAGFSADQIAGISDVAIRASRALGRDLTDAYTRVVRGSAKMETELLDELGIYTKIGPATRAYAEALGVSVTSLSEFQRRQAFVNAVIAEGQRKYASINTTIPTVAEKIEAFGVKILDIGTKLGGFLATALAPLAEFLTNNIGATLGTLGAIAALALGKAISEINRKLTEFKNNIEQYAQRASTITQRFNAANITAATTAVGGINLSRVGLTGNLPTELKALREIAQQRKLTIVEINKAAALLRTRDTNLAAKKADIQNAIRQQIALARAAGQGSAAYTAATAAIAAKRQELRRLSPLITQTSTQLAALSAAAAGTASSFGLLAATGVSGFLRLGAAITGTALNLVALGGNVLAAVSIFGLLGTAIAKAIGKGDEFNAWLSALGSTIGSVFGNETVRQAENVFLGSTANILQSLEEVDIELRNLDSFTFSTTKFFGVEFNITKTKQELVNEVAQILAQVSVESSNSLGDSLTSSTSRWLGGLGALVGTVLSGNILGTAIGGAVGTAIGTAIDYAFSNDLEISEEARARLTAQFAEALERASPRAQDALLTALNAIEERYGEAARVDPAARAALRLQQQLILGSAEYLDNIESVSNIIAATGQNAQTITENYDFSTSIQGMTDTFSEAITEIEGIRITFRFIDLDNEALREALSSSFAAINSPDAGLADFARLFPDAFTRFSSQLSPFITSEIFNTEDFYNTLAGIPEDIRGPIRNVINELMDEFLRASPGFAQVFESSLAEGTFPTEFAEALQGRLQTLLDASSSIRLAEPFYEAATALNGISQSTIRAIEVLRTLSDGVATASVSYEQFQQSVTNSSNALINSRRQLVEIDASLAALAQARSQAKIPAEEAAIIDANIAGLIEQRGSVVENVRESERLLQVMRDMEDSLKAQLDLNNFLTDITPQRTNRYQMEFDVLTASGQTAGEAMQTIAERTRQAGEEYRSWSSSLREDLTGAGFRFNESELSAILSLNQDSIEARLGYLRGIENVSKATYDSETGILTITQQVTDELGTQSIITRDISLLTRDVAENGKLNTGVLEAQNELLRQAIPEILTILNNREKILQTYRNELELSNLQRAVDADTSALERRRVATSSEIERQQQAISLRQQSIELLEREADITASISDIAIRGYQREIEALSARQELIDNLATAALADVDSTRTFANLSDAMAAAGAISSGTDAQDIAERVAATRVEAARAALALDLQGAEIRQRQAEENARLERDIAIQRQNIADAEYAAARVTLSNNLRLAQEQMALLEAEQALERSKITTAIELATLELRNQENIDALRVRQIEIDRDQNKQKITDEYKVIQANARLIDIKAANDQAYLTELARLIGLMTGSEIPVPELPGSMNLETDVNALIAEINSAYDQIAENALASAREQSSIETSRLQESIEANRALLASTIETQDRITAITVAESGARLRADREALATAAQNRRVALQAVQEAERNITRVSRESSNEQVQVYASAVARMIEEINGLAERFNSDMFNMVSSIDREIATIADRERILAIQFEIDSANLQTQLDELVLSQNLEALRLQVELVNAQENAGTISGQEAANQLTALEERMLAGRRELADFQHQRELEALDRQERMLAEQLAIDIKNIQLEAQLASEEITARAQAIQDQIAGYQGLISGLTGVFNSFGNSFRDLLDTFGISFSTALGAAISALAAATGNEASASVGWGGVTFSAISEEATQALTSLSESVTASADAALSSISARAAAQTEAANRAAERERSLISQRRALADRTHDNAMANLSTEGQIQQQNAIARQNQLRAEGGAIDALAGRLRDMQGSFESSIQEAFMGLNDLLFYGEGSIEEVIGGLFRSIQETVFEETIAKPLARWISERLTNWINEAVGGVDIRGNPLSSDLPEATLSGIQQAAPAAVNAATQAAPAAAGAGLPATGQTVATQINTATQTVTTALQSMGSRIQSAAQSASGSMQGATANASVNMQNSGQQMASAASTVGNNVGQAATTASSTMLSSMWILLPLLLLLGLAFKGSKKNKEPSYPLGTESTVTTPTVMQSASGGVVQLASGGSLRDRVPALLEPGEFVIRRPAARKLGQSALQNMNATGKTADSAPIVNVNNQGSGKTVERTDVNFDGDKYIIDIVLNDLNNNGPIRRSLRGGAV